jgi:hypothetical protein
MEVGRTWIGILARRFESREALVKSPDAWK